jgi:hypothetical protein
MQWMQQQFCWPVSEHTIFHGYRWAAWVVAGAAITVPGLLPGQSAFSPLLVWLLVFTFVLNMLATSLARSYVPLVQRRPWLLGADVLLGVLLLWASGGAWLPFLPYALGSLVLPVLLGVQQAVVMGLVFVAFDQMVLLATGTEQPFGVGSLLLRSALPFAFVGGLWLLLRGGRRFGLVEPGPLAAGRRPTLLLRQGHSATPGAGRFPPRNKRRLLPGSRAQRFLDVLNPEPSIAAMEPRQPVSSAEAQPVPRPLKPHAANQPGSKPALKPPVDLATALRQASDSSDLQQTCALHLELERPDAAGRRLSYARQDVLVRLAHEALRNIHQHAHAHTAWLTLRYEPAMVVLTIEDDGIGLLDGTHERPGLHSLRALRYRLVEMDGVLDVYEGDGGGVVVRGWLPLN